MFLPVFPICSSVPKDHNENKVYPDLYYAILANVSLDVEFLDAFDLILHKLHRFYVK